MIAEVVPILPSVPLPPPQVLPWWPFSAGDTILIISAVFNGVLLLLTAWRTGSIKRMSQVTQEKVDVVHEMGQATQQQVDVVRDAGQITQQKVDVVHDATNSRLSAIDGELRETRSELARALTELRAARAIQQATAPLLPPPSE